MIALAFTFLAGRYHATGWDHHVNEGTVEWPPSPWRILRALVAASHRLGPELDRARLAAVLERLTALPVYYLPPVAPGHLRHYMPTRGDAATRVFDAFLAVGDGAADPGEMTVAWPQLELDADERALLAALVAQISYLGRAESWVCAAMCSTLPGRSPDAYPTPAGEDPTAHARLLSALPTRDYHLWRDGYLAGLDARQRGKLRLPADLLEILGLDTGALQQAGWSDPPGTRWIGYSLRAAPVSRPRRSPPARADRPDVARIVLSGAVLPHVERSLWISEKLRAALLHHVGDVSCPVLTGKDDHDRPLTGHGHTFFLPQANPRGEVDQVVLYARDGFDAVALAALRSLRQLHGLTSHPVYTTIVALGRREALARLPAPLRTASRWESLTPFVPPRCPKQRRGQIVDSPEDQIRWLCRAQLGVEPITIESFDPEEARRRRLHWYRRDRRRGGRVPGHAHGHGFHLEFASPVRGPLALGYGAHFGLGQFIPLEADVPAYQRTG